MDVTLGLPSTKSPNLHIERSLPRNFPAVGEHGGTRRRVGLPGKTLAYSALLFANMLLSPPYFSPWHSLSRPRVPFFGALVSLPAAAAAAALLRRPTAQVLKPGLVKGQWSAEEDDRLVGLVEKGFRNWGQVIPPFFLSCLKSLI